MFRTFIVWVRQDSSCLGRGVKENLYYQAEMDVKINDYIRFNNVKVVSVSYAFVTDSIQHGSDPFNTERTTSFIAGVFFAKND